MAIITGISIDAAKQKAALHSEFDRRGLEFPTHFDVPDHEAWERGYAQEVRDSLLPIALNLDEALAIVQPFFDPLFARTALGTWSRIELDWVRSES